MNKRLIAIVLLSVAALTACGSIETGNVGVRTTFGKVGMEEEHPGFYTSFLSNVEEYSVKEITVPLTDLRPKALDNLSLRDLDISVSYIPNGTQVAEFVTNRKGQSSVGDGGLVQPGDIMVHSLAASTVSDVVSKLNSLTMHTKRALLEDQVKEALQKELNVQVPGFFRITRVVVTNLNTDPSIEDSIRLVVQNEKKLEAMTSLEAIARKQADIEVIRSQGIARANTTINNSLTREYLQHEANLAMMEFAKNGGTKTVLFPVNVPVAPLIQTN